MITSFAAFAGKKVLVVESEFLLPATLYRAIEQFGAELIGPVVFADDVLLILVGNCPDGAIVDSRLEPDSREAIFRFLRRMHVPFIETCGGLDGGEDGCFRLPDAKSDLMFLYRPLFA
jgi:hypothetical protein